MKKICSLVMILAVLLSCMLTACSQLQAESNHAPSTRPSASYPNPSDLPQRPLDPFDDPTDKGLWMGDSGKFRIRYIFNQSSVRYITSPEQLPDYEQLKTFDEKFFSEKALVLVIETVASGSVDVSVASIQPNGMQAVVTLQHDMPEGIGTGDMTTWIIWVVVDKDLDYEWTVSNPAVGNDTSTT